MGTETTTKTTPPAPAVAKPGAMVKLRVNPAIFPTDVARLQKPGVKAEDAGKADSMVEFTKDGVYVPAGDVDHFKSFKEGNHQMVVDAPKDADGDA